MASKKVFSVARWNGSAVKLKLSVNTLPSFIVNKKREKKLSSWLLVLSYLKYFLKLISDGHLLAIISHFYFIFRRKLHYKNIGDAQVLLELEGKS